MGSIRKPEFLQKPVKLTATTLRLPSGSTLNIGAMQYNLTANLDLNIAVTGVGGLDASAAAGQLYYVYAVYSGGNVYLIGSTNSSLPSGFTQARQVGGFTTNASSQIDQVGEYPGNLAVAGSVSAGGTLSTEDNRNYIINGGFDFWQRGVSSTAVGYLADRFTCDRYSTTNTMTRGDLPLGTTPGNSRYFLNNVVVSPGTGLTRALITQSVEDVTLLAGKTVTLSFWAKADSTKKLGVSVNQSFGTGGSPSADVVAIGGRNISITSSWQRYSVTFNLPAITGKTLGTNPNTSYTAFSFWFDGSSAYDAYTGALGYQSGTFSIAEVMLNVGSQPAPFKRAGGTIGGELELCQRYCEVATGDATNGAVIGWGVATGVSTAMMSYPFRTTKRSATSTLIKLGTVYLLDSGGNKNATFTRDMTSDQSGLISITGAAGLTVGSFVAANTYTGALGFECEL